MHFSAFISDYLHASNILLCFHQHVHNIIVGRRKSSQESASRLRDSRRARDTVVPTPGTRSGTAYSPNIASKRRTPPASKNCWKRLSFISYSFACLRLTQLLSTTMYIPIAYFTLHTRMRYRTRDRRGSEVESGDWIKEASRFRKRRGIKTRSSRRRGRERLRHDAESSQANVAYPCPGGGFGCSNTPSGSSSSLIRLTCHRDTGSFGSSSARVLVHRCSAGKQHDRQ